MFRNVPYLSLSKISMWKLRNVPSYYTHMGDGLQPAGCIWLCQAVPAMLESWRIIVQRKLEMSKPMFHILEVLEFSTGLIIYWDIVLAWSTVREIAFGSDSTIFNSLKSELGHQCPYQLHQPVTNRNKIWNTLGAVADGFLPGSKIKQIISTILRHSFNSETVMFSRPKYN